MNSMWVLRQLARRWVGGRAARDRSSRRAPRRARALPRSVRLAVEALEDRTLLSVLPAPITTGPIDVSHSTTFTVGSTQDNESAPSVAYDPVTPSNLVAVYTRSVAGQLGPEIDLATSTDGGQTWATSTIINPNGPFPSTLFDPTDFSTPQKQYTFATNPSVAFDRAHHFYVSALETDGADGSGSVTASGALVLKKFNFTGGVVTAVGLSSVIGGDPTTQVIYQWAAQDPAYNPRIAVDSNLPSYRDPVTGATVTDPFANPTTNLVTGVATDPTKDQVYVSWNSNNAAPTGASPSFNPNTIKIAASSDGGNTFSTQVFVNASGNFGGDNTIERDALPTLAIAQGSSAGLLPGGQLSVAWNNFASKATSIVTNRITNGGTGFVVDGSTASEETGTSNIQDAGPTPSGGSANVPMTTTFDLDVSAANPPANFTITDMNVSLALVHPNVQQLRILLIDPLGNTYTLVNNGLDAAGNDLTKFQGIKGVNLGVLTNGANPPIRHELDTVFDSEAARNIRDPGAVAPFTAHFQPEGPGFLTTVNGNTLTSAAIDGLWKLQITDFRNDGTTPPPAFLQHWALDFTAGLTTNTDTRAAANVHTGDASPISLGAAVAPFPLTVPSNPTRGVSPAPSLAVDNTLGSFSPFQGRLYIAYTGAGTTLAPPDLMHPLRTDTDVYLVHSDNGGVTWSSPVKVNDDSPGDNFSEGDRSQYEPSAAVDPVTGTLAITFYDARNDPANARVATYLATSIDGGSSFAPETYLNAPKQALDASQFNGDPTTSGSVAVTLGPIPDNQSAGNPSADQTFAFGDHQGLAVYGGHVYALWAGNQNGGPRLTSLDGGGSLFTTNLLDILSSSTVIAAGPRVFGQTAGGPVTSGTVFPDGTIAPTSFTVTFDRPVDINSFRSNVKSLVSVVYRSPNTPANNVAPYFGGTLLDPNGYSVRPLNTGPFGPDRVGTNVLATQFLVTFALRDSNGNPITDPVGTYSYSVGDLNGTGTTIQDDIRPASGVASSGTNPGNLMDQNGDAVTDQANVDAYANPRPLGGTPFSLPYDTTTLPLIVPGPHIVSSSAKAGLIVSASSDNLLLNNSPNPATASAIDVTFDRNMDATTFTTAQLLRLQGPVGTIPLFDSQGNPLPGVTVTAKSARTFEITLPTNLFLQTDGSISTNVTPWNILSLNGTYTLTLGTGIRSAAGDAVDTNENAGLAVLNGVDPSSAGLVPGGIAHTSATPVTIGPNSTAQAFITFPESFQIQHAQVLLNISVADSRDMEGFLISPDGKTVIKLFTKPGAAPNTGKQTGFINTVLDDLASTPIQPNASGTGPAQPLTGTFNPQQPLSSLNNTSSAGQWTLLLQNDSGTDTATLNNWKLTFAETQLGTGLGEPVADQPNVSFRIFSMGENAALPLATWTPVGPAAEGLNGISGRIGGIAVDPSDPSGNTVYVAGSTGGVWKTSNFLTTSGAGPTWIPLTDFGPNSGINIGGIAVFGRNSDPKQSIVYAVTGDGDGGAGEGVGVIRSLDGGAHWDLLDSLVNVYNTSNDGGNRSLDGQLLPLSMRDHGLVGPTAFKIVVDPVLNPSTGQPVLFTALSGARGGIYRSLDGGNTWQDVLPGNATDVALAPFSAFDANNPSAPPGNAQIVYAAFTGGGQTVEGVYKSNTEGAFGTWKLMDGQQGGNPLIQTLVMGMPATVGANIPNKLPQGGSGRIVLSVPSLTGTLVPGKPYSGGHPLQDLIQENWVYAAVVGSSSGNSESGGGGKLFGLFLTKDGGNNWTQVHIPYSVDETNPAVATGGSPTNDDNKTDFDPFAGGIFSGGQGNYDISLQVDPNNANVVYLGGTSDGPPWALSRIDTTGIGDPYAVVGYDNNDNDGGQLAFPSVGAALPPPGKTEPKDGFSAFPNFNGAPYINLLREPSDPFAQDATLFIGGVRDKSKGNAFTNEGSDIAIWGPFGGSGGTDHHRVVAFRDPITGKTRLIFGDDQGLWSSVDDGSGNVIGSLNAGGVRLPGIDRNGNLQIGQFYYGATQPSDLAAQIGGALFYANAQDNGFPQSDPNILTDGQIAWSASDGDGTGIATDQTGSGTVYTYRWPCCGGGGVTGAGGTDFFEVNSPNTGGYVSRTNGLIQQNNPGPVPDPQWPFLGGSNFAVNPSNGDDIIISSLGGGGLNPSHLFLTGDQGNDWVEVGGPELARLTPLDGAYAPAVGFGPSDPRDASGRPDLDNLYAGTSAGNLYVTVDGGGHWVNVGQATGVNPGVLQAVSANPRPGTHEAYVVGSAGVFHLTYQVNYSAQGVPFIVNGSIALTPINGAGANNLFALNHVGFANSSLYTEPFLKDPAGNAQGLDAIAVDWRFAIPDNPANPTGTTHPVVYVGGNGGIFRSEDNGKNWTPYPDSIPTTQLGPDGSRGDGAPVDGGLLPLAQVRDLDLVLGNVNPQTGLPDQSQGPNLLVATTYGRGTFAIRLPLVHPYNVEQTLHVVSAVPTNVSTGNNFGNGVTPLPNPVNPGVGLDRITVTFNGTVDPRTFPLTSITLSGPGGVIPNSSIRLTDVTNPDANGSNPHNVWEIDFPHQTTIGTYTLNVAPTLQDLAGRFMDQDLDDTLPQLDPLDTPGTPDDGDGFTGTFLIQGLQVVSASPTNGSVLDAPPGLSSATVTFNAPVDPASFTGAQVTLTGPTGPGAPVVIPGVTVKDITPIGAAEPHSVWEIDLPAGKENYPGTYTIQVGPNIKDTGDGTGSGNAAEQPMDQDEDSTSPPATTAEPPGSADDAFFLNYTVPTLRVIGETPDPTKPILTPAQQAGATGLQTITLTFSRDVDPASLVPGNFTLTGPATSTGPGPAVTIPGSAITSSTPAGGPANSLVQIRLPAAITTPGVYTLTVGPGVKDLNGEPMDQDNDPSVDAPGGADDAFKVQFSVAGLQVVAVAPATSPQPLFAGQTGVVVTFNEAVKAGTVDGNVVVLDPHNPATAVALGTAVDLNPGTDTVWRVPFKVPQTTYGTYTVTVGPGVQDLAGRAMNQNNNGTFGEAGDQNASPAGDAFTATFTVAGLKVTALTPAQAAVQPILEPTPGLQTFTVTFNMSVNAATFIPANLTLTGPETPGTPPGAGAVITIPAGAISDITPAGSPAGTVWQISLPSKLTTPGIYTLTVGTGVEDLGNNPLDQDQDHFAVTNPDAADPDAADNFVAQFDVDGLAVKSSAVLGGTPDPTASGQMLPGTVTSVQVTFNQPVLPSSITVAANNVLLKDPKGNPVTPTAIVPHAGDTTGTVWDVQFAGAQVPGVYTLTVGPGVEDLAANKMNQNHNLKYGEAGVSSTGDAYFNGSIFAVAGLRVTGVTPTLAVPVLDPTGLNAITVTFNREVDPNSFKAADTFGNAKNLSLVGPETPAGLGAAIPVPVADLIDVTPVGAAYPHSVWQINPTPAVTTPGIYTLTVGPALIDSTGTPMDQNANLKFGEVGLAPAGDQFRSQFDVDGLAVTSVTPSGPTQLLPGVSSATITFNQPVLPSSINAADVILTDPHGTVVGQTTVTPVAGDTTGTQWQLQFPAQNLPGVYTVTVLNSVKDLAGNTMNQNHNLVYGEGGVAPAGDEFSATFAITGLKVLSVTPTLAAPVLDPTGLNAIVVTFNREVDPASFTAADGGGNAKNLVLTGPATPAGPGAVIPIPVTALTDVTPAGAQFAHSQWKIAPTPAVTTPGIYTLTVGPAITDSTGTAMDQNANFNFGQTPGDQFVAQFDVEGLAVTSVAPSGPAQLPPGVSSVTITFNQPVLASSFARADVVLTDPNGNPVPLTAAPAPVAGDTTGTRWQVQFAGQKIPGVYTLKVLHAVEDLAGNAMNQNHNTAFGEAGVSPAGDDFSTTFAIAGLKVSSVTPTLAAPLLDPAGLGSVTITFNREVDPNSFTAANLVLTQPDGSQVPAAELAVTDLAAGSGDNVWEVDVTPALTTPGIYSLTIGPAITDSTGHRMDQNGNFTFGQVGDQSATPAGDQFTAKFDVDGLAVLSVAPAANAPVAPGISSAVIAFNQAVLPASLVAADVVITDPSGKVVPLTAAPTPAPGDTTGTFWQVQFAGQTLAGVYTVKVLHAVEDLAGNQMNQNHNATFGESGVTPAGDDFSTTFSVVGLEVASVTPTSALEPPGLGSVTITFNRPVNPATFTTADLTLSTPDGSAPQLTLKDLAKGSGDTRWELDFSPALVATGNYTLTVGPHVADLNGKEMDQNGAFTFRDAFTTALSVTTPASQAAAVLGNPLGGPVDVTGLVTILTTPPRRFHGKFMQQILIFNNTGTPIQGPFSLLLVGLPKHVRLLNPSGISLLRAPGSPFQFLFFPASVLQSFSGGVFTLVFSSKAARQIRYTPVLLVGFGIV